MTERSLNILIVERDFSDAGSHVRQLRRRGHHVDWTPSLQEARYFLSDFAYDVVLLDDEVRVEKDAWSLKAECENHGGWQFRRVLLMARNAREDGLQPDFVKSLDSFVRFVELVEERPPPADESAGLALEILRKNKQSCVGCSEVLPAGGMCARCVNQVAQRFHEAEVQRADKALHANEAQPREHEPVRSEAHWAPVKRELFAVEVAYPPGSPWRVQGHFGFRDVAEEAMAHLRKSDPDVAFRLVRYEPCADKAQPAIESDSVWNAALDAALDAIDKVEGDEDKFLSYFEEQVRVAITALRRTPRPETPEKKT